MFGRAPDVLDFWSLEPPYCRSCDASSSLDADALDAELYPTSYVAPMRQALLRVFITLASSARLHCALLHSAHRVYAGRDAGAPQPESLPRARPRGIGTEGGGWP